jgi:hypothetical protein
MKARGIHSEPTDGRPVDVPKAPTAETRMTGEMELTFPAPDCAVFRAPLPGRALWELLGGAILPVMAFAAAALFVPEVLFLAVAALILCAVGGVVALVSIAGSPPGQFGADLQAGLVYVEGLGRKRKQEWALADVAGVQICSFREQGAPSDEVAYEGNVVLRPDAERVRMWTSRDRERATRDARRFAAFIGKPFWDHT